MQSDTKKKHSTPRTASNLIFGLREFFPSSLLLLFGRVPEDDDLVVRAQRFVRKPDPAERRHRDVRSVRPKHPRAVGRGQHDARSLAARKPRRMCTELVTVLGCEKLRIQKLQNPGNKIDCADLVED